MKPLSPCYNCRPVRELRKEAEGLGIRNPGRLKKEELLEAIWDVLEKPPKRRKSF